MGQVCASHGKFIANKQMIGMWNNLHTVIIATYKIELWKDKYNKQKKVTDIIHLENISKMVFGYCIKQKEIGKLLGLLTLKCVNDII